MDNIIKIIIIYAAIWMLSWLLGGMILSLSIHHCWFIHTIATSLGVADGTFVNYANASFVITVLNTLRFNAKVK